MLWKNIIFLSVLLISSKASTDGQWNILNQTGYAGEVVVNSTTGSMMYYMTFQSIGGDINNDTRPMVIWLPGGPGCSQGVGMFGQRYSPLSVDQNGNPQFNNLTWALRVHIMSIDFPYGVGYSYPTNWTDWISDVPSAVSLFINYIDVLMNKYPKWFQRDIYIAGQDYAAIFIPAIANQIHLNNRNLVPGHPGYINLKGVILGDPWLNGIYQSAFYDTFAFNEGLANKVQKDQIYYYENLVIGNATAGNPSVAYDTYEILQGYIESISNHVNEDNYRMYSKENMGNLPAFFNNITIMQELNVPSNVVWQTCSGDVHNNLTNLYFAPQSDVLATLLGYGVNVLIYSSQDNLEINSMGIQTTIRSLNWAGINDFLAARRGTWNVAGNIAGYAQTSGGLTYVQVLNSGLNLGFDQTQSIRDMIFRFIFNQGWN